MYVIIHSNNCYYHNKGRIILFETQDEIQYFLELLIQYSTQRLMQEGNPIAAVQASMTIQSNYRIIPNFDTTKITCDTVMMRDLFEETR